jgi:hypothetical protein
MADAAPVFTVDWAFVGWAVAVGAIAFAAGLLLGWHHYAMHVFFRFALVSGVLGVLSVPVVGHFFPGRAGLATFVAFLVPFIGGWMGASVAEMISPWETPVVDPSLEHPTKYHVYDELMKGIDHWQHDIAPHIREEHGERAA